MLLVHVIKLNIKLKPKTSELKPKTSELKPKTSEPKSKNIRDIILAQPSATSNKVTSDSIKVLQANNGELLNVPGDSWLLKADFAPEGSDLLL